MSIILNIEQQLLDYLDQADYRQAYKQFTHVRDEEHAGKYIDGDMDAYRQQIEDGAIELRREITTKLDALLNVSTEDFQPRMARDALLELERAILDDDIENDIDYSSYKRRINNTEAQQKEQRIFKQVNAEVQNLWEQGYVAQRDLGNKAVLDFFNRAFDRVLEAQARYPNNTLIETLVASAEQERERMGQVENVMQSGGETEDFVAILKFINKASDSELLPVYDPREETNLIGSFNKEEARRQVIDIARPYVRNKLDKYIKEARAALAEYRVREAVVTFKRTEKFEELWEIEPDVVPTAEQTNHNNLRREIEADLRRLEDAEQSAKSAVERASSDTLAGWKDYENAEQMYEGTQYSEIFKEAYGSIQQKMVDYLERTAQDLQAQLLNGESEVVNTTIERLLRNYSDIEAVKSAQVLQILDELRTQTQQILRDKREINARLVEILNLVGTAPNKASEAFETLRQKFDLDLLKADESFLQAQNLVKGAMSLEERLSTFEDALNSTDYDDVHTMSEQASDWAQNPDRYRAEEGRYQKRFQLIANQLAVYTEYLAAERRTRGINVDLEWAINTIQHLQSEKGHRLNDDLQKRIAKRLEKLQHDYTTLRSNTRVLERIEELLENERMPVDELLRDLGRVTRFVDTAQQSHWFDLLERTLQKIDIRTKFDTKIFDRVLRQLGEFNTAAKVDWEAHLKPYRLVQQAHSDEGKGDYEEATHKWEEILPEFGGRDREYAQAEVNRLNRIIMEKARNSVLQQDVDTTNGEIVLLWLNDINTLSDEMKALANRAVSDVDKLFYMTSTIELDVIAAQREPDAQKRLDKLKKVTDYTNRNVVPDFLRLKMRKKDTGILQQEFVIADWVAVGLLAQQIGIGMDNIYRNLTSKREDIASFKRALDKWDLATSDIERDIINRSALEESRIQNLMTMYFQIASQWVDDYKEQQRANLKRRLDEVREESENPEARALPYIAKLYFLDKNDPDGEKIIEQLEKLEARLMQNLTDIVNNFTTAIRYKGQVGVDKFNAQVTEINHQAEYVQLIHEVLPQLPNQISDLVTIDKDSLKVIVANYMRVYDDILQTISLIREEVSKFNDTINNVALNSQNWLSIGDVINKEKSEFVTIVDKQTQALKDILSNFNQVKLDTSRLTSLSEEHPYIKEMINQADKARDLNVNIAQAVKAIVDSVETENYAEAQQKLGVFAFTDEDRWQDSRLYDEIRVETTEGMKSGWDAIVDFIKSANKSFNKLETWYKPYYDKEVDGVVPPSKLVVNWNVIRDPEIAVYQADVNKQQDRYYELFFKNGKAVVEPYFENLLAIDSFGDAVLHQVEYLIAKGDFEGAIKRLKRAIGTEDKLMTIDEESSEDVPANQGLGNKMSLRSADAYFGNPPLLTTNDSTDSDTIKTTSSYIEAINVADSQEAKDILRWMETHRYDPNHQALEAAQTLLANIPRIEQKWIQLRDEFSNNYSRMTALIEKYEDARLFKNRHFDNARRAYVDLKHTVRDMELCCPLHSELGRALTLMRGAKTLFKDFEQ